MLDPAVERQLEESFASALNDTLQATPGATPAKLLRGIGAHLQKQADALLMEEQPVQRSYWEANEGPHVELHPDATVTAEVGNADASIATEDIELGAVSGVAAVTSSQAFTDEASLFSLLDGPTPPIRLLRGSWFLQRVHEFAAESQEVRQQRAQAHGGVHPLALPKRQDLECQLEGRLNEAFLDPEELRDEKKFPRGNDRGGDPLPLICVSHAWHGKEHPDPLGDNLIALAEAIQRQQSLSAETYVQGCQSSAGAQPLGPSFALFFDWACLPQKERSKDERVAFDSALSRMQILYAHKKTLVYMLTQQPEGWSGRPYHERGWPTFEMRVSMLLKLQSSWAWNNLVDTSNTWDPAARQTQRARILPPLTPDAFKTLLRKKKFTNGKADMDRVADLYESTIKVALSQATQLRFSGVGWKDVELYDLIDVLPMCTKLETLNIGDNPDLTAAAGDRLAEALRDRGTAPALRELRAKYSGGVTMQGQGGELKRACEARRIDFIA